MTLWADRTENGSKTFQFIYADIHGSNVNSSIQIIHIETVEKSCFWKFESKMENETESMSSSLSRENLVFVFLKSLHKNCFKQLQF